MNHPMLAKFAISYTVFPEHNKRVEVHHTDDPVEAETFLARLLASGSRIHDIKHDGVALENKALDRMIRIAAERHIAGLIEASLGLDYAEVRHRFGLSA